MILIFFILGLIVGSFLNVVIYRLNIAESILGRSFCPNCKGKINWYDNIPVVSFLLLKMRCRSCHERISWQYPIVELAAGFSFALIGSDFDPTSGAAWISLIYALVLASFLIVIFFYDLLYMEIPSLILWLAIFGAVVFGLYSDWDFSGNISDSAVFSGILGSLVSFVFFFALVFFSKEKWMGMGDAYLAILLGFLLGWPKALMGIFLAFFVGAMVGIVLIFLGKKKMSSQIPFAPFFISGSIMALVFYDKIINWYFGLF